ncbi:hypothetical protein IE81DRAFT_327414 [Ceraceosorus guamensis]|uniref:Uncharacterized protein n=1 Tax=Ceraceosorus guamensis TaxID=1522189 RepID=A0A316WH06_9BASI|nr:hypothetical protein IE81DRAFT_327414 [Ceraceosorus guamensis]PWN46375.1 hypothetical protein IE81DRAFT_327414 [Ceraceosorus guamensis]
MTNFGLVSAPEEVESSEAGGSNSSQASPAAFRIPLPATEEPDVDHPNRPTQRRLMPRASESMLRQRTDSTISATSSATSSSIVPGAPPRVKRVPVQALSHFPPPAPSGSKGTARGPLEGSDEASAGSTFEEPEDIAPGESGVDDLLRLAEKARMLGDNGREDSFNSTAGSQAEAADENSSANLNSQSPGALHAESGSSVTSSLRMSGANEWKPNKWTFGASRAGANEIEGRASKPPSQTSGLSAPSFENTSSIALRTSNAGYNGWNDAPEPSLKAHTSGKVAHAYGGKGGKNKRVYAPLIPGNSVLDDLAAGLPPNPGPASNWARPISDSVPMPGSGPAGGTNQGSSSAARKGRPPLRGVQGGEPARATQGGSSTSSAGWGQLFSDTLRGRIKLEEALERGYQEVAASFEGAHTNATSTSQAGATGSVRGRHPHTQPHLAASPPERPSAELARQTLGRSAPVPDLPASNGGSTAGGSGADCADPHELERLHSWGRGPPGTVDPAASGSAEMLPTPSGTRQDPMSSASTRALSASSRGAARRRGVKDIDWTST